MMYEKIKEVDFKMKDLLDIRLKILSFIKAFSMSIFLILNPNIADAIEKERENCKNITIKAVGDMMIGTNYPDKRYLSKKDGADVLEEVKVFLKDADIVFGNLEGPMCDDGNPTKIDNNKSVFVFRMPTYYVKYFKDAGFNLLSIANNHINDFGIKCRKSTEEVLNKNNINWSGPSNTVAIFEKNNLKIGFVAFSTDAYSNNLNDYKKAAEIIKTLKNRTNIVVVSIHAGREGNNATNVPFYREYFYNLDRGYVREFVDIAIANGADIILGHGPHVLRGIDIKNKKLIAYSLGNFATYGRFNIQGNCGISIILEAILNCNGDFLSGKVIPIILKDKGIPMYDNNKKAIKLLQRLNKEDRFNTIIDDDGSIKVKN